MEASCVQKVKKEGKKSEERKQENEHFLGSSLDQPNGERMLREWVRKASAIQTNSIAVNSRCDSETVQNL